MKVLVIDDDPICLKVLTMMLKNKGCIVETAMNATAAKEVLANASFQVIFTDLGLPDVDDVEFIQYLCQLEGNIPVVVISGHIIEEASQHLNDLGVSKLLEKPIFVAQIDETLQQFATAQ